jgi:hypothetical protein
MAMYESGGLAPSIPNLGNSLLLYTNGKRTLVKATRYQLHQEVNRATEYVRTLQTDVK